MEEQEWQPVRIAPMTNLDPMHGPLSDYAEDYNEMVGKIVRVRPANKSLCLIHCQQYEIHPDDRSLVESKSNPGTNVWQFCPDQILAD